MATKTLWQILTEKKEKQVPIESTLFNPYDLKIGNLIEIELENLDDVNFTVKGIREVSRYLNGNTYKFADYELYAKPYGQDEMHQKLRVIPNQNDDYDIVVFEKLDSFGYNEQFENDLNNNPTIKEFEVIYDRVNGLKDSLLAESKYLYDKNQDGVIDYNDFENTKIKYWDFFKEDNSNPDFTIVYLYLVEMNVQNGFFEIWTGRLVDSTRVKVK